MRQRLKIALTVVYTLVFVVFAATGSLHSHAEALAQAARAPAGIASHELN